LQISIPSQQLILFNLNLGLISSNLQVNDIQKEMAYSPDVSMSSYEDSGGERLLDSAPPSESTEHDGPAGGWSSKYVSYHCIAGIQIYSEGITEG